MAEYGSRIFYGRSNSFPNSANISQLGFLSLPPELDLGPPLTPSILQNEEDIAKDIILLAEFSEVEGPIPLVTIPKNYDKNTDLNELVLQLMSTDYHSLGRSDFQIQKDICMLQEDHDKRIFTYVHYFILYDVRARGFVRPMCLAYISREPKKLSKYYKKIEKEFCKATEYLRICNLQIFCKELKTRMKDLQFTKERFIHVYHHIQKSFSKEVGSNKENVKQKNSASSRKRSVSLIGDPPFSELKTRFCSSNSSETMDKNSNFSDLSQSSLSLNNDYITNLSYSKLDSSENYGPVSSKNVSTPDTQKLANHIRSHYKSPSSKLSDSTLKASHKENLLLGSSYSSDSSTSSVKSIAGVKTPLVNGVFVSSLLHDHSVNEILNSSSEEIHLLQHTSLDALALQLLDCQYILGVIQKYLRGSESLNEMEQFLTDITSNPHSPLFIELEELGILKPVCDLKREPVIFVISLMRRNFRSLRLNAFSL
ncbi:Smith-Magenis syndrome chromosomal region candidate protein 8 [Armadillidium nasatum]|uniref:Smith-Magenis syndrome chromosomal region candidate protein 8 n=1 Tax=Armadillidium nasatum TaxID=96803 RepID=A0A5N5SVB2_9CRUS|nr:Smith-Magenis syndrome chromosomal region candidate protein 8 [Armadillidium nasatum]